MRKNYKIDTIRAAKSAAVSPTFKQKAGHFTLKAYLVVTFLTAFAGAFFYAGTQFQGSTAQADSVSIIKVQAAQASK